MKPIPMAALAGATALVLAGCDKKSGSTPVEPSPPPAGTSSSRPAAGTPASAPMPEERAAEGEAAVSPDPGIAASAEPEPPTGTDDFSLEAARILRLPAGPERDDALGQFVRNSMHGGFERTDEWILKMPAGRTRDIACTAFIESLAKVAPGRAFDYTSRISDPGKRASLEAMLRSSPGNVRPPEPAQDDDASTPAPR